MKNLLVKYVGYFEGHLVEKLSFTKKIAIVVAGVLVDSERIPLFRISTLAAIMWGKN